MPFMGATGTPNKIVKTITFTGGNNLGELDAPTVTFFTVTGEVLILFIIPFCTVDLVSAGGGTLLLGITGSTSFFLGSTTATALDAGEFWTNATPVANGVALPAGFKDIITTDDVIGTVGVADITGGALRFTAYWLPISEDGNLT